MRRRSTVASGDTRESRERFAQSSHASGLSHLRDPSPIVLRTRYREAPEEAKRHERKGGRGEPVEKKTARRRKEEVKLREREVGGGRGGRGEGGGEAKEFQFEIGVLAKSAASSRR